jgi:hypothetical protein
MLSSLLLYGLLRWQRQLKPIQLLWIGIVAGVMLYSQKSAYFLAPIVLVVLLNLRELRQRPSQLWYLVFPLLIALIPLVFIEYATLNFSQQTLSNAARLNPFAGSWLLPFKALRLLTPLTAAPPQNIVSTAWTSISMAIYLALYFLGIALLFLRGRKERLYQQQAILLLLWWLLPLVVMTLLGKVGLSVYLPARNDLYVVLTLMIVPLYAAMVTTQERAVTWVLIFTYFSTFFAYHLTYSIEQNQDFRRDHDRQTAQWLSREMSDSDACVFVDFSYFSHARYMSAQALARCVNYQTTLNPRIPHISIDEFLARQIQSQMRLWVLAPLSKQHSYLEEVLGKVDSLAGARQLSYNVHKHQRIFDWQGTLKVLCITFNPMH